MSLWVEINLTKSVHIPFGGVKYTLASAVISLGDAVFRRQSSFVLRL